MPDEKKQQQPQTKRPARKVGEGLDRSNEGAVEVGRARRKPAPIGAPADRYTTDSRRKG
jgi:hypothetical protein